MQREQRGSAPVEVGKEQNIRGANIWNSLKLQMQLYNHFDATENDQDCKCSRFTGISLKISSQLVDQPFGPKPRSSKTFNSLGLPHIFSLYAASSSIDLNVASTSQCRKQMFAIRNT